MPTPIMPEAISSTAPPLSIPLDAPPPQTSKTGGIAAPPVNGSPADLPDVIDLSHQKAPAKVNPWSWEPGQLTSEFKLVVGILGANVGIIAVVLGHLGVTLDPGQQQQILQWIGAESSLLGAAYAGFRSLRKGLAR